MNAIGLADVHWYCGWEVVPESQFDPTTVRQIKSRGVRDTAVQSIAKDAVTMQY